MRRPLPTAAAAATTIAAALFLILAPAAGAQSNFRKLAQDFRGDGSINGCDYSDSQLRQASSEVPPDIAQYAPAFGDSLQAARERRASGGCTRSASAPSSQSTPVAGVPAGGGGGGTGGSRPNADSVPAPPAPKPAAPPIATRVPLGTLRTAGDGSSPPAAVWALFAISGLAALAAALALAARYFGWDLFGWSRPLRAGTVEAGTRTADAASTFRDWLRLGR